MLKKCLRNRVLDLTILQNLKTITMISIRRLKRFWTNTKVLMYKLAQSKFMDVKTSEVQNE